MVTLTSPKQFQLCRGCLMLFSSQFLQFCAVIIVLSSITLNFTRLGNVAYANFTHKFGNVQYAYEHNDDGHKNDAFLISTEASSASSASSASTPADEQNRNERKPADITLTNAHDILYYGVLKNKYISTTSIQSSTSTTKTRTNDTSSISTESEENSKSKLRSSKSNMQSKQIPEAKSSATNLHIQINVSSSDFQSGVLGETAQGEAALAIGDHHNNSNNKLRVIVTGMEHTGTTILSELIMSAPGFMGPFETGFLLAETPSDFRQVTPFFEWVSRTDVQNAFLGSSPSQVQTLLQQPTHTHMYMYAMENSVLFENIPSRWYVDKTPTYVYSLRQVMERVEPGVKVVVSMKSYEAAHTSWVTRRNASEAEFNGAYQMFQTSVQEASKAFPGQIYLQDYGDLFGNYIQGNKASAYVSGKLLFDWLGLEWKNEFFTGKACADKGRPCNMASLLDH